MTKYKSKYTDKEVSGAQIITEKACEAKARSNKTTLPYRFWELPEWSKFFKRQIVAANTLLKLYSVEAVLKTLSDPQYKWIYSLSSPQLLEGLAKYQKIVDTPAPEPTIEASDITAKPRQDVKKKKGLLDRLD